MNAKTFLFVGAWMKPLKNLPLEQRWNVLEAITEYATTGQMTKGLDLMETVAFLFIRNEIDRMNTYRKETSERRRSASIVHSEKKQNDDSEEKIEDTKDTNNAKDANDANTCKPVQAYAPFDIESVSESISESNKKSTSTTRTRVRESARKVKFLPHAFFVSEPVVKNHSKTQCSTIYLDG